MKAIVFNKRHSGSKLQNTEVDKPRPKDNEVLIKVICTAINAADYRSLKMGMIPKSKIFGAAIAGIVESCGINISLFKPGDEVVGDLSDFGFGGFAEYAVAPEIAITIKPPTVSFEDAAALPVSATTALKALRDVGDIQEDQQVLIVGASGGVGTIAIRLAKYYGGIVTAVCSTSNEEQARALGADYVIDYTKEDFLNQNKRFDLILAINGNYPLLGYKALLKPNGTYVMVGGSLKQIFKSMLFCWILSFGSKKMRILSAKSDAKDLAFLLRLLEEGKITSNIEKLYPFDQTPDAMAFFGKGHSRGKVIIQLGNAKS